MTMLDIILPDRTILGVTRDEATEMGVDEKAIAKAESDAVAVQSGPMRAQNLFDYMVALARGIADAKDLSAVKAAAHGFLTATNPETLPEIMKEKSDA